MLQFLVTGTIRSGTAYTAQVLNRSPGIACGHGWVYTPDGVRAATRYVEFVGDACTRWPFPSSPTSPDWCSTRCVTRSR